MTILNLNSTARLGAALSLLLSAGCSDDSNSETAATADPTSNGESAGGGDTESENQTDGMETDPTEGEAETDPTEGEADTEDPSDTDDASSSSGGETDTDSHGTITECSGGEQEACKDGGTRFCFLVDEDVTTHEVWGECGECVPGEQQSCGKDGEDAIQFCNASALLFAFPEEAPAWGLCIPQSELVCELDATEACPENEDATRLCILDEDGAPAWDEASCG